MASTSKHTPLGIRQGKQLGLAKTRRTSYRRPFSWLFFLVLILSIASTIGFLGLLAVAVAGG